MIQFISNMNFWHFVVLKSDLLSEAEVLQTANEYKIGSYYPEMYRFPKYDIIKLLHVDPDVTNQLLNSAQTLESPRMTWLHRTRGSNCSSRGPKDNFFYKIFFLKDNFSC